MPVSVMTDSPSILLRASLQEPLVPFGDTDLFVYIALQFVTEVLSVS